MSVIDKFLDVMNSEETITTMSTMTTMITMTIMKRKSPGRKSSRAEEARIRGL